MLRSGLGIILLLACTSLAHHTRAGPVAANRDAPLEIRLAPSGAIFLNEVNRARGIADLVVQNVALVNRGRHTIQIEYVRFDVIWRGNVAVSDVISRPLLEASWGRLGGYLAQPGVLARENATFFFDSLLAGARLGTGTALAPNEALILGRRVMTTVAIAPDSVRVTVGHGGETSGSAEASHSVPVLRHRSPNSYAFPLTGRWFVASSASLASHHRWRPASEFALDLVRIGAGGSTYAGDGSQHEHYLAFGQPVLAAADGVVVDARDGMAETPLPLPGESRAEFAGRALDRLWEQDPGGRLADGNIVVIRHGGVEYTSYAHLRHGSVRVAVGDSVRRGQTIAEIGMSGDGFEPHLHFQATLGAHPHFSRGLPIVFDNVRPVGMSSTVDPEGRRPLGTGEFVEAGRRP